jgi:hypothetical protein
MTTLFTILGLLALGAIVNGPLFSLDASGKIGNALVYTKWKGRSVVREYVIPANPNSFAQRAQRVLVAALNALWKAATPTDKDSWVDLAIAGNYSTFNGFMSFNLDAMGSGADPTINRDVTPAAPTSESDTMTATGGVNRVEFAGLIADPTPGEVLLIAMVPGTTPPGKNLAALVHAFGISGASWTGSIEGVPAGTYAASSWTISDSGDSGSSVVDDITITVTGTG